MQNDHLQDSQIGQISQTAATLPKVERQRLHDTVVEHLRNFIVEGLLAPGVKLNERTLCETLGISRTPLREALKVLASEGLIDILPNRGASVSQMSEAEIRETFELMSGLEAFSGELACERITSAVNGLAYRRSRTVAGSLRNRHVPLSRPLRLDMSQIRDVAMNGGPHFGNDQRFSHAPDQTNEKLAAIIQSHLH